MFVDHTKQLEKYMKGSGMNFSNIHTADANTFANGVLEYGKSQETYRMTEGGSFFMPQAVYQKPGAKEEENVLAQLESQLNMTAENRRNQMIVVMNTASAEDLSKMAEEGFSSLDMDSHTILTVTDKIKAALAQAGVDISMYGDSLSQEELEAATGSKAVANQIANELQKADLPTSEANIQEGEKAYAAAKEITSLNDASKEYLLRNHWEPTIKNLYIASHSGVSTKTQAVDLSGLDGQMKKIIQDVGLEVSEETMDSCKWLIEKNIGLTTENLKYLVNLNHFSAQLAVNGTLDMSNVLGSMVEAIGDGKRPMDAILMEGFSYADRAQAAMDTILSTEDCDLAYCVEQNMQISVENLQTAIYHRGETGIIPVSAEMANNIHFITAKRQLEETRLVMTTEANRALLKRGFSIDTKPLEMVVENLKNLENQYAKDLMSQSGIDTTEENVSVFTNTTRCVQELKFQPAYALQLNSANETLQRVHEAGSALKASMDAALQSYETMWTAPRSDMGDSIQKAFGNIGEILKDLGLEDNERNQRAVRILAYNQTELTVENIIQMKTVDLEMQKLFQNLTPATTLELIRRGENPLDMEIEQLNEVVENIQSEIGDKSQERFSKFLWKLEQTNGISEEERESFIGIYRLITQVEKNDGAALGALIQQDADITMRNLLTATRSAKKTMDYTVDDTFAGVKGTAKGPRIDAQIMASFQNHCMKEVAAALSPEKLAQLKGWEDMTPEELLEAMQQTNSEESTALEQQYYTQLAQEYTGVLEAADDVYAFLEKYDIRNSANNVLAASRLLENPSNAFATLFGTEGKSQDYKKMIAEMKEQILKNFGEAIKTPKEMADAQATLAEVAEKVMQTMIIEDEPVSSKDLNDLRLMSKQFYLCGEKAKEESFLVPVETSDGVTGISLKIVRGKADKGLIDIFFRGALMQKVAASFEAKEKGISGMIAVTDKETKKLFEENADKIIEQMNADGKEKIDITVAYVEDLSAWQFEKKTLSETGEATPVQTKRLYHIAESFIQSVSELM